MMSLGNFRFNLSTAPYQSTRQSTTYRWPAQDSMGRQHQMQVIGLGEDTLNLEGVIYPRDKSGLTQIDAMRLEANKGSALLLIDEYGNVKGHYVITAITEHQSHFLQNGTPQKVEFTLSLKRQGA